MAIGRVADQNDDSLASQAIELVTRDSRDVLRATEHDRQVAGLASTVQVERGDKRSRLRVTDAVERGELLWERLR
jgi:hypothetical protein